MMGFISGHLTLSPFFTENAMVSIVGQMELSIAFTLLPGSWKHTQCDNQIVERFVMFQDD